MPAPRSAPVQAETRPLVIYIAAELREQLKAAKDAAGMIYASGFCGHLTSTTTNSARRRPGQARLIRLDMRSDALQVFDDTTERLQIPNRNELLVTVIELGLGS